MKLLVLHNLTSITQFVKVKQSSHNITIAYNCIINYYIGLKNNYKNRKQ